jgi:formylglycine-generating enzyme required for sulfatase activity
VLIGRHPVTNAQMAACSGEPPAAEHLAGHPATGVAFDDAVAFCAWASARSGRRVRLPSGAEWEAAARGDDGRPWPWGHAFDPDRCACAEANAWTTAPVDAHPAGAAPCGAEQLAGNVWEWVGDPPDEDGWRRVRGGCHLDHAWGVRASRSLPADPGRATYTTGFRIAIDIDHADEEVP